MRIARTVDELRDALRAVHAPLGFVPTMGALHDGHLALVRAARAANATVVASIFVNPLQFGPSEDFDRYPRAFAGDVAALEAAGVDVLFAPDVAAMYGPAFGTSVDPGPVGERYEGALRPGHFRGVATVCAKLFHLVAPQRAYFGQKDGQQVAVLRRIVADLAFPLELTVLPTIREDDGLALSSRNVYLSADERAAAPALHHALVAIADAVRGGETDRERALARGRMKLLDATREAYLDVVDAQTFEPAVTTAPGQLAIGSVYLGTTRILDNEPIGLAS